MPGPSWLPTRPAWIPNWDETYKRIVLGIWPRRMVASGSNLQADIETRGHALSWVRELFDWILHAFFPANDSEGMFLDRWEKSLGMSAGAATVGAREDRITAALRQRHTMTEDAIKAIFARAWATDDPAAVSIAFPSAADIATYSTNELTNLHDQNFMLIYRTGGPGADTPDFTLADDLIRRLKPAWQRWAISSDRSMRYGDGGTTPRAAYRWGRSAIGNG